MEQHRGREQKNHFLIPTQTQKTSNPKKKPQKQPKHMMRTSGQTYPHKQKEKC